MATPSPAAQKRRARLTQQLHSARERLIEWEASIRTNLAALPPSSGPASTEVESMIATLVEARRAIEQRLCELEGTTAVPAAPSPPRVPPVSSRWRIDPVRRIQQLCVRACRACGRALATAFRRARASADLATAQILYGAMRAFEKQIWLLDPHHARPQ